MNRLTKSLTLTFLLFSLLSVVVLESFACGDLLNAPRGTALAADSIVVDSNVAIALQRQAQGLPLQDGHKAILKRLQDMGATDLRIATSGASEITNAGDFGRLISRTSGPDYDAILKVLDDAKVGGTKGVLDRQIVAETFFAQGHRPTLLTLDSDVYKKLPKIAGHDPAKLGKAVHLAFPNGFAVTINGRTIWVMPVGI